MLITIDYREKDLIEMIQLKLLETESEPETEEVKGKKKEKGLEQIKIKINVENLKLGDIVISHDDVVGGNELLLFERKSLNDLASSIKDGRYAEQSFRLGGYESVPNHNIVYIIEGDLSKWKENAKYGCKNRVNKKTLLSSMCSMLYYKGFSVIRTMNMTETCELILNWADKLQREKGAKKPYYSSANMEKQESQEPEPDHEKNQLQSQDVRESHYCDVFKIKKEKNGNITPGNIGEIMLCTIPGISSKTAIVIMKEFKTINGLIKSLENDAHCLNNIYMETNGKKRKISSQCIENIRNYLLGDV
uniref:ERCC4 domain-containing protein n=1 Tax=viral metagenome TaxID=1070528 RepID=A0A6C0I268_9ZZZZ